MNSHIKDAKQDAEMHFYLQVTGFSCMLASRIYSKDLQCCINMLTLEIHPS